MKHYRAPFFLRVGILAGAALGVAGLLAAGASAAKLLAAAALVLLAVLAWGCSEAVRLLHLACAAPQPVTEPSGDTDELPTL